MLQSRADAATLASPSMKPAGSGYRGPLFLGPMLLVLLVGVGVGVLYFADFRPTRLKDAIQSVGPLAPVFYVVLYTLSCVVMIPASILTLTGGLAFGPVWGTLYSVIGAMFGASAARPSPVSCTAGSRPSMRRPPATASGSSSSCGSSRSSRSSA